MLKLKKKKKKEKHLKKRIQQSYERGSDSLNKMKAPENPWLSELIDERFIQELFKCIKMNL